MKKITILRLPTVLARTGLSRSTWYSRVKQGTAPQPIALGSTHATGWLASEVDEFLEAQVRAARPASTA